MKLGITDEDRKKMLLEGYKSDKKPSFYPTRLQYDTTHPEDRKKFIEKVLPRGNFRELASASQVMPETEREALMREVLAKDEAMGYNKKFDAKSKESASMPSMNIYANDPNVVEPVVPSLEVQPLIPQTPMQYNIPKMQETKIPEKSVFHPYDTQRLDKQMTNVEYAKQWLKDQELKQNRDKAIQDEINRRIDEVQNLRQ
jgi:hypothetical protein